MTRKSPGVLTIINPAADPDNYVDETTPPIAWTFTGRTQESAQVKVWHVKDNGSLAEVWTFPRTVMDDTSVTMPAFDPDTWDHGTLLKSGEQYKVAVSVWDTVDRQSVAGDLASVRATRLFTYQRDGTPDPPETLTAEPAYL